mgnify:CR=1 FL=1
MPWYRYTGDSHISGSVCSQASPCGSAYYRRKGNFHTDFLWCNFTSQNFSLYNRNTTYQDGARAGQWTQSQVCPLTHMATAIWANTNRTDEPGVIFTDRSELEASNRSSRQLV